MVSPLRPPCCPALLRTEVFRFRSLASCQRLRGNDEDAADRIAYEADTRVRRDLVVTGALKHTADEAPHHSNDDQQENELEQQPVHDYCRSDGRACGSAALSGWALLKLASAWRALPASGDAGPSSMTRSHALAAPSRSCLPKARTIPMFNSVFVCPGSIVSDLSNCLSATWGGLCGNTEYTRS